MENPILVTGAAGRVGAIGRTVTELLLKQGKAVRAMVRNEDERAQALRDLGAEVVVDHLSGHSGRAVAGPAPRGRLAAASGEPSGDDGRSASRWPLRPDVGRRVLANGARAADCAGFRQEECGGIHRVSESGLSVCECSYLTEQTLHLVTASEERTWQI